jgi:hypothetical protein
VRENMETRLEQLVEIVREWVENDGCGDYDDHKGACSDRIPGGRRDEWCPHCRAREWLEEEGIVADAPPSTPQAINPYESAERRPARIVGRDKG